MLDVAREIKTRFMNNNILDVAERLQKEGYILIYDIYNDITIDDKVVYRINVFKDDVRLVQVLYTYVYDYINRKDIFRIYTILY